MNEFLHNLRNKSKRYEGNRRPYPNPQYQDRRNGKDNRKNNPMNIAVEQLSTALSENLPVVKTILEGISANQKRLAQAEERRAKAEERKAAVLESIVEVAKLWIGSNVDLSKLRPNKSDIEEATGLEPESEPEEEIAAESFEENVSDEPVDEQDKMLTRDEVMGIISEMRDEGATYNQIANYFDGRDIPTFSGKGKWRGQTVHRLYQKITA